jgi:hypothetical protein
MLPARHNGSRQTEDTEKPPEGGFSILDVSAETSEGDPGTAKQDVDILNICA